MCKTTFSQYNSKPKHPVWAVPSYVDDAIRGATVTTIKSQEEIMSEIIYVRNFIFPGLLGWKFFTAVTLQGALLGSPSSLSSHSCGSQFFDWCQNETQWKRAGFQAEARQEASQPSLFFYQQQNPPSRFPKIVSKSEGRMLQMSPKHLLPASFCKRAICF